MVEEYKRMAAWAAVEQVRDGMTIGLGGGSTAALALERLGTLLRQGQLRRVVGVPCSQAVARRAAALGMPLVGENEVRPVDVTIDGADEVDPQLNLIKGGGGALLREKIVAQASDRLVIVVDYTKLSPALGTKRSLPVDVVPFGWAIQRAYIRSLGGEATLRTVPEGQPFVTDDGHYVLDCRFGPIVDPEELAGLLAARAGIVEHGLFVGLADEVISAGPDGLRRLSRPGGLGS
ncbi:MAG: ribose-5-phosphate isomerase RpiA [Anaerolineae bacterium]|nr:ribose-5-phosphate isomerase RpiA [Anaerolineae bacterium]